MNRNTELHFSQLPSIDIKRSTFNLSHTHKTTFNTGELVPIYVQEILPGDTFVLNTTYVIRSSTPIKPVMDNAYIDFYFFFVPNRLTWNHWQEFMGENTEGAWDEEETEYTIPTTTTMEGITFTKGSLADHMGLPINISNIKVNQIPFRDYTLIWNEWFRDQNIQAPLPINKDSDGNDNLTNSSATAQGGGMCLKANKFHDYFTSGLPEPQKGDPVTVPLGDTAPVIGNGNAIGLNIDTYKKFPSWLYLDTEKDALTYDGGETGELKQVTINGDASLPTANKIGNNRYIGLALNPGDSGMIADLSQATAITINQLRQAVQTQKFLERDARCGTRYTEIIKGHFGITSPDARMQRPEYLGGKRVPINISQVLQTSASQEDSPQGNTAAFSLTGGENAGFTKSFTEHGFVIGLAVVRTEHSYQQGINRMWSRQRKFDYYWPEFAHIGEQAVLNKEIYAQGTSADDEVFDYQERYGEYRYNQNIITGEFRSTAPQTLDIWHYGDNYETQPYYSNEWIQETTTNVDRTLSVQSSVSDQFQADFYFKIKATRPIPLYGVPGLMDHF